MVSVTISRSQINAVKSALGGLGKGVQREIATAVNATAKKTVSQMAKTITSEIKVTQKKVKESLKAKNKANKHNPKSTVTLSKTDRISLKEFGARHTKAGVTYLVNRKSGRQTIAGAFMGPKPGAMAIKLRGHAFIRQGAARKMKKGTYVGQVRQPIHKLWGASPWGVFAGKGEKVPAAVTKRRLKDQRDATEAELKKQVVKRINFLKHKAAGTLRGKQPA